MAEKDMGEFASIERAIETIKAIHKEIADYEVGGLNEPPYVFLDFESRYGYVSATRRITSRLWSLLRTIHSFRRTLLLPTPSKFTRVAKL